MYGDAAPAADAATPALTAPAADAGNTPTVSEPAPAPDANTAAKTAAEPAAHIPQGVDESQLNAGNTVIQSKNGQYTIGFEKLEHARQRAQAAEAQAAQLQQEIERLRSQPGGAPVGGQLSQETQEAVKEALNLGDDVELGDFTEEDFKKAFMAERAKGAAALKHMQEQLQAQFNSVLEPLRERQEVQTRASHRDSILEAHADAYEIGESAELKQWVESKPAYMRPALEQVLSNGVATDVVQLLNDFKQETGRTKPPQGTSHSAADARAQAKALLEAAPTVVPNSLSQVAGASQGASSPFEAMANLDAVQLAERLAEMTPDQREAFYARNAY